VHAHGVHKGDPFELIGDCIVVTVSLGVLKASSIQFEPALPHHKMRAISRLGFGLLDKVVLVFKKIFWDMEVDWFSCTSEKRLDCKIFMNPHYYTKKSFKGTNRNSNNNGVSNNTTLSAQVNGEGDLWLLVAFVNSEFAKELEKQSDSEAAEQMLCILEKHYGNQVRENFVKGYVTRWALDPFALGSYSYATFGATPQDQQDLGAPVPECQFYFAGEASIRHYYGTVHGAFLSGQRAADEVAQGFHLQVMNEK
jgi:lysine-specific histone demethylase 1